MEDVPELPLEKIFAYLSLEDRIRSRAVSRKWCKMIDSFRVKCLCYSERPIGFIKGKSWLVSGAFAQNFIGSPRIGSFFRTFANSILSDLKQLHLCGLFFDPNFETALAQTLHLFGQLEELVLFQFNPPISSELKREFTLTLPMLNSIQLEDLNEIKLTLDAPRLHKVKLVDRFDSLRLDIVRGESVEELFVNYLKSFEVNLLLTKLKNLKALYIGPHSSINPKRLSNLEHLKEIHLNNSYDIVKVFKEVKQRNERADLKIHLFGLLLDGRDDPAIDSELDFFSEKTLDYLAENLLSLAQKIPFCRSLDYVKIKFVAPGLEIPLLNRFTDLTSIIVTKLVYDIEPFLNLLSNCSSIGELEFQHGQRQDLFDRLPEHCTVKRLAIESSEISDFQFLSRIRSLVQIDVSQTPSIDVESIGTVLKDLAFLQWFDLKFNGKHVAIRIKGPERFCILIDLKETIVSDRNAVIQSIIKRTKF